jgi:hypothetical protein
VKKAIVTVRTLIKKIHKVSRLKECLKCHCVVNNEPEIIPCLDIKIRWNSVYDMLSAARRISKSLDSLCDKESTLQSLKINSDWEIIDAFILILSPFKKATLDLCGETTVDGSKLYLLMNIISNHIKDLKFNKDLVVFKQGFEEESQS